MRHLRDFLVFDFEAFINGKTLMVTGCKTWKAYDSKEICGTVIETAIVKDNTQYKEKDGEHISNRFEKLNIKVKKMDLNIPLDTIIRPINAVASVYGEYNNQLSVTAEDIQILQPKKD